MVDEGRFNMVGGLRTIAPGTVANPGRTRLVEATGHSIHADRSRWLSREIYRFICSLNPPRRVLALHCMRSA